MFFITRSDALELKSLATCRVSHGLMGRLLPPALSLNEVFFWLLGGDFLLRLLHTHAVRGVRQHLFWDLLPASVPNIGPTCDQLADEFDFGLFDPQFVIWVHVNRQ